MARLYFRIESDWQIVVKTREEVARFEKQLLSMNKNLHPEAVAELEKQLAAAKQKLSGLVTEAAKAAVVFENDLKKGIYDGEKAVNSLSEEIIKQNKIIRETQNDVSMLTEQYKKLGKYDPKRQSLSDELNRAKAALKEQKYALGELRSEQSLAKLSTKALKDEYALYKDESKGIVTVNEGIGTSFKKVLATMGGVALLKQVASNVVSTAGMFQKYESVLTNALNGSSDKAKAYLSDINSFAAKTNFQLNELTDDFIKFVNRGVTPSMDAMKKLGDFTNTVAKPFDQLTEAILDVNNSERWKEFGVRVQTEGNKVKLSFRDMTVECDRTVESVMKAVEQFGSMKGVEGSTEAIAKTIEGQMSNFEDTITTALAEIGLANQDLISGSISTADTIVKNYGIIGKSVLALIEIYGVYRAGLLINTIVEQGSVKSIWAKITATKAATIAQAAYNKVLAMNPYVAVGMAVVSLGIAMWTMADNTSEAEKAQNRFNERQEEAVKREQEHKQKIDDLINSSRDIALADLQRGQSLAELRKEYPKIFAQYDIETIKLADILKLKQQIAEEDEKRAGEKREKEFSDLESEINYYENLLKSLSGQQGVDGYVKKLKELRADRDVMLEDKGKGISEQFISSLKDIDISEFDRYVSELEKRIKGMGTNGKVKMKLPIDVKGTLSDEAIYDVKDIKTLIDTAKTSKANRIKIESEKTTYKDDYEKAKKDWEDAKKKLSEIEKDKSKFTSKQYEDAKKRSETAEKVYKDLGGVTNTTKQESAAEKLRKEQEKLKSLQEKQSKDSIHQSKDLEFEAAQSRIDAMKGGLEKTIAQMNLNHQKEIETLKRNREDYLRNKIEGERIIFEANPSNKGKSFDASTVSLSKEEKDMFKILMESTISKQGDEIATYYKDLLSKYQGYTEKRLATQKKFQEEKDDLVKAGASKETLAEHDYQRDETYKSIDNEFAMREDSFKAWADNIADLSLEKLRELLVQAERELERSEFLNPNDPKLSVQRAKVTSLKNTISEKSEKTDTTPDKRSQKEWQDLYNTLSRVEKGFDDIGDAVGGAAGEIISAAGGITTSTLQMIDGIVMLADSSSWSMVSTATAAEKAIKMVENASVILAVIGAALQIATKIANMFGTDYSNYNKAKENYENYVAVLDTVIGKQKELMETMTGKAALEASQRALELIEKQAEAARILGKERLNAGASAGSHSIGVRIRKGMSSEGWNEAKKALGSDFYNKGISDGRMTGLFDLSVEQLEKLQMEAPTFWAKLDGDVREYLEQIIACNEKTEEMKDLLNEALTQVSFDDVYSNFLDALSDMDASSEEFADNFEGYMQKAILNSMLIGNYKSRIDAWYKAFAKANDDNAGITQDEYNNLQKEWNEIVSDAIKDRDSLKDMFGWTGEDSTSQDSTSKGFQAMSQDTGEELNGRFTALQIAGEEIKNQAIKQTDLLSSINDKMSLIDLTNENLPKFVANTPDIYGRTKEVLANSYQPQITINFPSDKIESLAADVSGLKGVVDEMRTLQVEKFTDVADGITRMAKNTPVMNTKLDSINDNIKKAL